MNMNALWFGLCEAAVLAGFSALIWWIERQRGKD